MKNKVLPSLLAIALAGCGASNSGTIVGFVVNGQTGERMDFFSPNGAQANLSDSPDSTKQVYTLINGNFVRATPCGAGFIDGTNKVPADGCFKISGVPYGEQLPIFAVYDGFEDFMGIFEYPGPTLDASGNAVAPAPPQVEANIRMFPKNYTVDYKVLVSLAGRGINGVTVACQIQQELVKLDTSGSFIPPTDTTSQTLSGQTANDPSYGDGFYKLNGTDLVLGAPYACNAFMTGLNGDEVVSGSVTFTAGVDAPEVSLQLKQDSPDPDDIYAVYSNADDPNTTLTEHGSLIVTFNRPVEIVPNTALCEMYGISAPDTSGEQDYTPPTPPTGDPGDPNNPGVKQVNVTSTNGDTTLTFQFINQVGSFDTKNIGASVTFSGIFVRPKDSTNDDTVSQIRSIGILESHCPTGTAVSTVASKLKNAATGGSQTSTIELF